MTIRHFTLPDSSIVYEVMRASGNGGQGVNTTDSAVRARVTIWSIPVLTYEERGRVVVNLRNTLTDKGELLVKVQTTRSQYENKIAAKKRLEEIIRRALIVPEKRIATIPTYGSQKRRIAQKKYRGKIKVQRKVFDDEVS